MNSQGCFASLLLATNVLAFPQALAAEQSGARYKFTEGTTNAYRVSIESPSQTMPMRFEGYVIIGVRAVDEGVATVFFRGRMQPKAPEGGRAGGPMPFGGPGPFGRFGPRFEPWRFTNLTPFNEAQIDTSGRILRVAGLQELPTPLETYADFFFHHLPSDLSKTHNTESPVTVEEEGSGRGRMPGGFHPGGPGGSAGRLSGIRKESIQIGEKSDAAITLHKITEFQSFLKTDDEPRLAVTTKSELIFDPAMGALKSGKIEGTAAIATLEVLQRLSMVVRVDRLEGADLAKAIAENAERPATITDDDINKLITDLQGDDHPKRAEGAQRLLAADLDKHAATLLPIVLPFLKNSDDHLLNMVAARVLGKAATREHLPLLHRLLKQEDRGHQHEVIQALKRLKDKSSIQPLSDMIAYGTPNAYAAAEALGEFGPFAEETALALLKEKHLETRRNACQILRKAGTSKSIEALQAVIAAGDPQLIHEATETVRSIRQRDDEAAKLIF